MFVQLEGLNSLLIKKLITSNHLNNFAHQPVNTRPVLTRVYNSLQIIQTYHTLAKLGIMGFVSFLVFAAAFFHVVLANNNDADLQKIFASADFGMIPSVGDEVRSDANLTVVRRQKICKK